MKRYATNVFFFFFFCNDIKKNQMSCLFFKFISCHSVGGSYVSYMKK